MQDMWSEEHKGINLQMFNVPTHRSMQDVLRRESASRS